MKNILRSLTLLMIVTLAACGGETSPETAPVPEINEPVDSTPDESSNDPVEEDTSNDSTVDSSPNDSSDPYDDPILPSDGSEEEGYGSGGTTEPDAPEEDEIETDENGQLLLTLTQLSQFDGKDGRRAFIAVSGVVYEVTNSPRWRNGIHNGDSRIAAGNDLTSQIDSISPHGRRVLDNIPRVGRIVEE
jgi:predicted heme/steroid binding protein/predicted small lipoprotein YifL